MLDRELWKKICAEYGIEVIYDSPTPGLFAMENGEQVKIPWEKVIKSVEDLNT